MQVTIGVSSYWDWEQVKDEEFSPTEEEILRMDYKESINGSWLKRVLVDSPSETTIVIPESQIEVLMAHNERVGALQNRKRVIADYIEDKIMAGHAPACSWTAITVESDPDLESYLNGRFEIGSGDDDE